MEKRKLIGVKDIKPTSEDFEVVGVFNAASAVYKGEVILLMRVAERLKQTDERVYKVCMYDEKSGRTVVKCLPKEGDAYDFSDSRVIRHHEQNYLTAISHFCVARSRDGVHFEIDETRTVYPATKYEEFGIEDPRITRIGDTYYITYVGVSDCGINTCLMRTDDFITFERLGIIFYSDNKDVAIFPDKINGKYYALHRPSASEFGKLDIWIAESDNLLYWGNHKILMRSRPELFDNYRLGAGSVPFLCPYGYIAIYHTGTQDGKYMLGSVLLDKNDPQKVLSRCSFPLVEPTEDYEKNGFFKDVIFTCGSVVTGDEVRLYYGASDECIGLACIPLAEIYENLGVSQPA